MPSQILTNPSPTTTAAQVPMMAAILSRPGGLFMPVFYSPGVSMSIRERSIMRWIRQKWAEIRGDRLTILNALSVPSTGLFLTSERLPYVTTLYARPPQIEGLWRYEWRWITSPISGVTMSPITSAYTALTVEADAEIGVLARLVCVGWCDGVEYRSDPYAVQVLPLSSDV